MRWLLLLLTALASPSAFAASYVTTGAVVIDPILYTAAGGGGAHSYAGANLEPGAALSGAQLAFAQLPFADLFGATLGAADLSGASLTGADLGDVDFAGADLSGTDLAGADLSGARNLGSALGSAVYSNTTDFTGAWTGEPGSDPFDPVAAGWTPAIDTDGDTVSDPEDNCRLLANKAPADCDTDDDGYGNRCDGDFDQNHVTNANDFGLFVPDFKKATDSGIGSDMSCNGTVNAPHFGLFVPQFKLGKPGPSGLSCAGTVPCDL